MNPQPKSLRASCFLFLVLLIGFARAGHAQPGAILSPVLEVHGAVDKSGERGAVKSTLRTSDSVAEGNVITSGADSGAVLSPLPGVEINVAHNTSVALVHLGLKKRGEAVQSREVAQRLEVGTLSFSLDKLSASKTNFVVQTPHGLMSAYGSVGTVTVVGSCVKIASVSGKVAFTPTSTSAVRTSIAIDPAPGSSSPMNESGNHPIVIKPGWFLAICGKGDKVEIRVIDTIARTWTSFSSDGTQLSTRGATVQEMESTRGFFATALENAAVAVSYGVLGAEGSAEVTDTLTKINQSFAEVGLAPIEASAIGSSKRGRNLSPASAPESPGSPGFSGGPTNPANTSGEVISRER